MKCLATTGATAIAILTGRTMMNEIKRTCASYGLPPDDFSALSFKN